ncbi:MAG: hypothetical protein OEL81_04260 [Nitrosopumilus sp.]|nr:hypothetical protein [Nitrosopumilus sp.]
MSQKIQMNSKKELYSHQLYKVTNLYSGTSIIVTKSEVEDFSKFNSLVDKPIIKVEVLE